MTVCPLQVASLNERVQKSRDKDAKSVTANSNFEKQMIENGSARYAFHGTRPERARVFKQDRTRIVVPQTILKRRPGLSQAIACNA